MFTVSQFGVNCFRFRRARGSPHTASDQAWPATLGFCALHAPRFIVFYVRRSVTAAIDSEPAGTPPYLQPGRDAAALVQRLAKTLPSPTSSPCWADQTSATRFVYKSDVAARGGSHSKGRNGASPRAEWRSRAAA